MLARGQCLLWPLYMCRPLWSAACAFLAREKVSACTCVVCYALPGLEFSGLLSAFFEATGTSSMCSVVPMFYATMVYSDTLCQVDRFPWDLIYMLDISNWFI